MIVRVNWAESNGNSYHVWSCKEYFVEVNGWSGGSNEPSRPSSLRLMLDGDKHDIAVSNGDTVFIMNDEGKTIDVIRT